MPFKRTAMKLAHKLGCLGALEPEQETEAPVVQPALETVGERTVESVRPYRDFVETEARQYWQGICKVGSLRKPVTLELYETLPIWRDATYSAVARTNYAEAETAAMQPWSNPAVPVAIDTERPHQAFVENEARKYWQEMAKEHNLTKPTQEETRAAAMPILCQSLRNRTGYSRHRAVAVMVQHARERGWINRFHSEAHESPSYIGALIQLADDANWLAREIPLPDHPPPRHPPVYYTIGYDLGRPYPVPRRDAVISGRYIYNEGIRLTRNKYIYPIKSLPGAECRLTWSPFESHHGRNRAINRFHLDHVDPIYYGLTFERARKPLNRRGVYVWFDWRDDIGERSRYFSSQLRDYPYPSRLVFSPPQDSHK